MLEGFSYAEIVKSGIEKHYSSTSRVLNNDSRAYIVNKHSKVHNTVQYDNKHDKYVDEGCITSFSDSANDTVRNTDCIGK